MAVLSNFIPVLLSRPSTQTLKLCQALCPYCGHSRFHSQIIKAYCRWGSQTWLWMFWMHYNHIHVLHRFQVCISPCGLLTYTHDERWARCWHSQPCCCLWLRTETHADRKELFCACVCVCPPVSGPKPLKGKQEGSTRTWRSYCFQYSTCVKVIPAAAVGTQML